MWLDVQAKDLAKSKELLVARKGSAKPGKPIPFLDMDGPASYDMLCEAGVSAMEQGMKKWGKAMWDKSINMVPLAGCIRNNWKAVNKPDYDDVYTLKHKVWLYITSGQLHELHPHQGPGVRYLGDVNFTLIPPRL